MGCAVRRELPCWIVCLAGVSAPGHMLDLDVSAINRTIVLENNLVFGTVNANRAHYDLAAEVLAKAEPHWLDAMITAMPGASAARGLT